MAPCSVIYCEQGFNGIARALHISIKRLNRITVSISLHQFRILVRSIREPAKDGIQNNSTPMHVIIYVLPTQPLTWRCQV